MYNPVFQSFLAITKNASPDSARTYLSKQAQNWVIEAGGKLVGDLNSICEISPLTSFGGEGLEELVQGKNVHCPFSI